ncbi:hypothetical protein Scel_74390 [Streptomyces cellostaticus]|nr:hypothetical protein Scel_74390 [Streptomyces cellostaticus]
MPQAGPSVPRPPADGDLPPELTASLRRSAELAAPAEAMEAARLVIVTGVGGVGRSRPAVVPPWPWDDVRARAAGSGCSPAAAGTPWPPPDAAHSDRLER